MVYMSAKFDEDVHTGLVSFMFITPNSGPQMDTYTDGTKAA